MVQRCLMSTLRMMVKLEEEEGSQDQQTRPRQRATRLGIRRCCLLLLRGLSGAVFQGCERVEKGAAPFRFTACLFTARPLPTRLKKEFPNSKSRSKLSQLTSAKVVKQLPSRSVSVCICSAAQFFPLAVPLLLISHSSSVADKIRAIIRTTLAASHRLGNRHRCH